MAIGVTSREGPVTRLAPSPILRSAAPIILGKGPIEVRTQGLEDGEDTGDFEVNCVTSRLMADLAISHRFTICSLNDLWPHSRRRRWLSGGGLGGARLG